MVQSMKIVTTFMENDGRDDVVRKIDEQAHVGTR